MIDFSSLNPYESLEVVVSDSPQGLVEVLKQIKTPIKIVAIVAYGNRHAAYILGDVTTSGPKKKTKTERSR